MLEVFFILLQFRHKSVIKPFWSVLQLIIVLDEIPYNLHLSRWLNWNRPNLTLSVLSTLSPVEWGSNLSSRTLLDVDASDQLGVGCHEQNSDHIMPWRPEDTIQGVTWPGFLPWPSGRRRRVVVIWRVRFRSHWLTQSHHWSRQSRGLSWKRIYIARFIEEAKMNWSFSSLLYLSIHIFAFFLHCFRLHFFLHLLLQLSSLPAH